MRYMTPAQSETISAFATKFPLPATEEACRAWTGKLAQQFAFSYGPFWGWKRADPGRPLSSDVIAYNDGAMFIGYDVISNAGAANAVVIITPQPIDLTGQVFVRVESVNYLGTIEPPVNPPETIPVCQFHPLDISPLLNELESLRLKVDEILVRLTQPSTPVVFPEYTGKLGFTINLKPKEAK